MSETKFTPGRWVWKYENLYSENDGEKDKPVLVTDYEVPERTTWDSHLIAAAPDLYEALQRLVNVSAEIAPDVQSASVFTDARAALAKARGES